MTDTEYDTESEYEYTDYGRDGDEIVVAGGGLGNGNAYATVRQVGRNYIYTEYGKNPTKTTYMNAHIDWDDAGYRFNIIEE
jgi:hypothetical protein